MKELYIDVVDLKKEIEQIDTGDMVYISGDIYTARDAAHKRMSESLENGDSLPFDIRGQIIYYMGPSPARPGNIIGSAGPTTSSRMDKYTPKLLDMGLLGMIGKGRRSEEVKDQQRPQAPHPVSPRHPGCSILYIYRETHT